MQTHKQTMVKLIVATLMLISAASLYLVFADALNLAQFQQHQQLLTEWLSEHYSVGLIGFVITYTLMVAVSLPGASLGSLIAGFLFGTWIGTLCVILGASLGALLVFLLVRYLLEEWVREHFSHRLAAFNQHVSDNALSYLLFLRLVPVFPFWLVNIAPALLKVRTVIFFWSTFIGIIPGSIVYVSLGSGLAQISAQDSLKLNILFTPQVFLPLMGLGVLSLIPIIWKRFRKKDHDTNT